MARKVQQLSIDGIKVEQSKARFADTFEVADGDERLLAFDEEVVYVVVARVSTPSFREDKHGEVSRVNVLKVKEARLVRQEEAKAALLDKTKFDYRPQPSLFDVEETEEVDGVDDGTVPVRMPAQEELPAPAVDLAFDDDYDPTEVDPEVLSKHDQEMEEFLARSRKLADEYEEEEPEHRAPEPDPSGRKLVDARGAAANDPMLARFLSS